MGPVACDKPAQSLQNSCLNACSLSPQGCHGRYACWEIKVVSTKVPIRVRSNESLILIRLPNNKSRLTIDSRPTIAEAGLSSAERTRFLDPVIRVQRLHSIIEEPMRTTTHPHVIPLFYRPLPSGQQRSNTNTKGTSRARLCSATRAIGQLGHWAIDTNRNRNRNRNQPTPAFSVQRPAFSVQRPASSNTMIDVQSS